MVYGDEDRLNGTKSDITNVSSKKTYRVVTLYVKKDTINLMDLMVNHGFAPCRSELIRNCVHEGMLVLLQHQRCINTIINKPTKFEVTLKEEMNEVEIEGKIYLIPNQKEEVWK